MGKNSANYIVIKHADAQESLTAYEYSVLLMLFVKVNDWKKQQEKFLEKSSKNT